LRGETNCAVQYKRSKWLGDADFAPQTFWRHARDSRVVCVPIRCSKRQVFPSGVRFKRSTAHTTPKKLELDIALSGMTKEALNMTRCLFIEFYYFTF